MSTYLPSACNRFLSDYQLPKNLFIQAAKSFVVSFGIVTLITSNPGAGAIAGLAASVMSVTHGLIGPLWAEIFNQGKLGDEKHNLKWYQEFTRIIVALAAGSLVLAAFAIRLDIVASAIFTGIIMLTLGGRNGYDTTKSGLFFVA